MPVLGADIAIHAARGFVAAIELKNRRHLTRDVAVAIRRNMAARGGLPPADYLLLLSQDFGYLWSDKTAQAPEALPELEFPMREVIEKYAPSVSAQDRLRPSELHLIVVTWLTELAVDAAAKTPAGNALENFGFAAAIRDGTWVYDTQ